MKINLNRKEFESEENKMMNPLDLLIIVFLALCVLSLLGIAAMYIIKTERVQKGMFYFLVAMGVIVAANSLMMVPTYMVGSLVIRGLIGALSIAALLVQLKGKNEKSFLTAKLMVTAYVVVGLILMAN